MGQLNSSLQKCKESMATSWSVKISFSPPEFGKEVRERGYLLDFGTPYVSAKDEIVPTISSSPAFIPNDEIKTTVLPPNSTSIKYGWTLRSNQDMIRDRRQNNRHNRRRGQPPPPNVMNDVIPATITHLLGGNTANRIQWKIKLPQPGTYKCTVLVGDPSFATTTHLSYYSNGFKAPPTKEIKVIENLQLPVGIQKHITFDVTTTETCELEFFNTLTGDVPGSREKRNSIKISTIQFEMQGKFFFDFIILSIFFCFVESFFFY